MKKYELITPTDDVIDQFNKMWNGEKDAIYNIELFKESGKTDISEYDCIKNQGHSEKDKSIEEVFSRLYIKSDLETFEEAVEKINSIYHTMLKDPKETAKRIYKERTDLFKCVDEAKQDDKKYINAVNFVACIDKKDGSGSYLYSFATKFCSFLARAVYKDEKGGPPIFDAIASNLIKEFLNNKGEKVSMSAMGEYGVYYGNYNNFKELYEITKNNKEVDIFLWLYGKVIQEYWQKMGVLSFNSVYYKPPQNK